MKHKIAKFLHRIASLLESDIPGARLTHIEQQTMKKFETIEVKDTYEAAFYLSVGGQFVSLRKRRVPENKWEKYGYKDKWYITISGVPSNLIDKYRNGSAYGNVCDMKRERLRIKRYADEI